MLKGFMETTEVEKLTQKTWGVPQESVLNDGGGRGSRILNLFDLGYCTPLFKTREYNKVNSSLRQDCHELFLVLEYEK